MLQQSLELMHLIFEEFAVAVKSFSHSLNCALFAKNILLPGFRDWTRDAGFTITLAFKLDQQAT